MSAYFRTQGIVLRKQDIGEADRVFTVFTKDFGKVKLRAVSERKIVSKLRGGLELFYYSEIAFVQGKAHKTITDAVLLQNFSELRADMQSMRVMYRLAEITDEILKGQEKDEKIWMLLQETLFTLNISFLSKAQRNIAAYYFLWNLLETTGHGPSLSRIAQQDENIALMIQTFLQQGVSGLQSMSLQGINERLLQQVSQEYLLKVLEH